MAHTQDEQHQQQHHHHHHHQQQFTITRDQFETSSLLNQCLIDDNEMLSLLRRINSRIEQNAQHEFQQQNRGLRAEMDDKFNELFTRLTLSDIQRHQQTTAIVDRLRSGVVPVKYYDELKSINIQLEQQMAKLENENRQLTESIAHRFLRQDTSSSGEGLLSHISLEQTPASSRGERRTSSIDSDNASSAHSLGVKEVVDPRVGSLEQILKRLMCDMRSRNERDNIMRQMLVDSRSQVVQLQRQLDESTEKLRSHESVVQSTVSRQLGEIVGPTGASKESSVESLDPLIRAAEEPEHVSRLRKLYRTVSEQLTVRSVAAELFQRCALTVKEHETIRSLRCNTDASETLLGILLKSSREMFECFLHALRGTNQEHIYRLIQCADYTLDTAHCRLIQRHYLFLVDTLDCKYSGLVGDLYSAEVLTKGDKEDIEAERTSTRQNEKLLSVLSRKSPEQFQLFLTALDNTGQRQITNILTGRIESASDIEPRVGDSMQRKIDSEIELKRQLQDVEKKLMEKVEHEKKLRQEVTAVERLLTDEKLAAVSNMNRFIAANSITTELKKQIEEERGRQMQLRLLSEYKTRRVEECTDQLATVKQQAAEETTALKDELKRLEQQLAELQKQLEAAQTHVCSPYVKSPRLEASLPMPRGVVGLTQRHTKVFVVCSESNTVLVFGANNERLADIKVKELKHPSDIAASTENRQLYVADASPDSPCVWRVSLDHRQVVKWLPNRSTTSPRFNPWTLSVTSHRLLVTSRDSRELLLHKSDGVELKRVLLPEMETLQHAVETPRGSFIVSHLKPEPEVCEVDAEGHVMHIFGCIESSCSYLSLDSDGRVLVVDTRRHQVLLLSSRLEMERVLLDRSHHQLAESPMRLCCSESAGRMFVGSCGWLFSVQVFTVR